MQSRLVVLLLCGAYALVLDSARADVAPLRAGVATADVTPSALLPMWGYSDRTKPAVGALDPLLAKFLVLEQDGNRVAIVALDLGRTPDESQLANLTERTKKSCQVEQLFVTASHTHQAPSLEAYGDAKNPYIPELLDKLAEGIAAAAAKLAPVSVGLGRGTADLAHNRRRILPDGRVAMQWRNTEREPTSPVDPEFTVVRLNRADGTPLAVLLHYACHPVVLGSDHDRYSADYVGAMRALVEKELDTTCLFLQGGCGDINPYVDKTPVAQGGIEAMRSMGKSLAAAVIPVAREAKPIGIAPRMTFIRRDVPTRLRWDLNDPEVSQVLAAVYGRRFTEYLAPRLKSGEIELPLTLFVLHPGLALVGMPGEIFVRFQLDFKSQGPEPSTLLVGYTNGYHAYFPTIRDAALGGYGGKTATYVAVGTAERLRDESLVELFRLSGQLAPRPVPDDFRFLEWDELKERAER